MEKIICPGFFLIILVLGISQCAELGENIRNFFDAVSKNETRRIGIYHQILKQETENEQQHNDFNSVCWSKNESDDGIDDVLELNSLWKFSFLMEKMNDSGTSVAPDDLARVDIATSPARFDGIPMWNWHPALISTNVEHLRPRTNVAFDHDYSTSASFSHAENHRRVRINHRQQPPGQTTDDNDSSSEVLPSATMMVDLLENRHLGMLYPRVVLVNHDHSHSDRAERITTNHGRNVFIDFFGGGDSPETIIEYYRRRILHAITAGRRLLHAGGGQYVRAE